MSPKKSFKKLLVTKTERAAQPQLNSIVLGFRLNLRDDNAASVAATIIAASPP
jgi:hypothetical protein